MGRAPRGGRGAAALAVGLAGALVLILVSGITHELLPLLHTSNIILQGGSTPTSGTPKPVPRGDENSEVALCLSVKEDYCDLREWVLHHATIGVGKFYVFDTGSRPPMLAVLDDFVASGLVEYHYLQADAQALANRSASVTVPTNSSAGPLQLTLKPPLSERHGRQWQMPIYDTCLQAFGDRHRWMGFIDSDEFVLLQPGMPSLPALLDRYSGYGGLVLHWRIYGSSPHVLRPSGGVLASYTTCWPREDGLHGWIKSFVQPARALRSKTVHNFLYDGDYFAVDTEGRRLDGPRSKLPGPVPPITFEGALLAHYQTRSLVDFLQKAARGDGGGTRHSLKTYLSAATFATKQCDAAVPLGRALASKYDLAWGTPPRCHSAEVAVQQDGLKKSDWLQLLAHPEDTCLGCGLQG